ncbi:class I SAM-dependent DNA methyltransferase [Siphonobacter sp. SORGH_AS_0500]|uniref:HsdM family class I SAM-dependent methyltransferase n=1 Tax=Siphonobacter sp. SORGH_AS_0500 TaxID=1864824 RepID=UPI003510C36C
MNSFLHQLNSNIILGDALTEDADGLSKADLILANPPFGSKAGSVRKYRDDILMTNKQLAFLQHIYLGLKPGGRAAVVVPDNVLFEEGIGKKVRQELMDKCNLHTVLRLPTGIFYSPGVKTNVLFFTRGESDKDNTQITWIYDMRSNQTKFGRKRTLIAEDFAEFERCYGQYPEGLSDRLNKNEINRWRHFTRQQIAERNDDLDIIWFGNGGFDSDESLTDPGEIAGAIFNYLREALNEIENISIEIDSNVHETIQ